MDNKTIFLNYLFGDTTYITYVAASVFVFLGLIIKWYVQINKAIKVNPETPDKFSWEYFLANNLFTKLFSIIANIVIGFIALRFSTEIFNVPLSMAFACSIGICFDFVVDKISKWQGKLNVKT